MKFIKYFGITSGKLHCGGMLTIILKHPALTIRFPSGLEVMDSETHLKTNVFQNIHILRTTSNNIY